MKVVLLALLFFIVSCNDNTERKKGITTINFTNTTEEDFLLKNTKKDSIPSCIEEDSLCHKIPEEMGSIEQCVIENSTMKDTYKGILENKLVDDSIWLLKELPQKDTVVKPDIEGISFIKYSMEEQKVTIDMEYFGGVTTIVIKQQGKNIIRQIIYSAD